MSLPKSHNIQLKKYGKQKYFYKLVNDTLKSCYGRQPKLTIQYERGEWVYPKLESSRLFVFDSVRHVRIWRKQQNREHFPIYKCEVKNPSTNGIFLILLSSLQIGLIEKMWDEFNYSRLRKELLGRKDGCNNGMGGSASLASKEHNILDAPNGTVWCDAVKLVEQI